MKWRHYWTWQLSFNDLSVARCVAGFMHDDSSSSSGLRFHFLFFSIFGPDSFQRFRPICDVPSSPLSIVDRRRTETIKATVFHQDSRTSSSLFNICITVSAHTATASTAVTVLQLPILVSVQSVASRSQCSPFRSYCYNTASLEPLLPLPLLKGKSHLAHSHIVREPMADVSAL